MKIYIGSDHAGYKLKEELKKYLLELGLGYEVEDKGPFKHDPDACRAHARVYFTAKRWLQIPTAKILLK